MSEYSKRIVAFSAIAIILGIGISAGIALLPFGSGTQSPATHQSLTMTSTATVVQSVTSVVSSATAPCGSPGAYCGRASITSANLTVGNSSSTLQITLAEIGNMYIGSATVYVNGTVIGTPPTVIGTPPTLLYLPPGNIILNIQANESSVLVLVIPTSTIAIHVGVIYSVLVYAWLGPPGQPANSGGPVSANVTAV